MNRLLTVAAVLLASSAARAGDSYSFEIGGRTVHIEAPSDCDSPSCVSVSIPGVYESGPKRGKRAGGNLPAPQPAPAGPTALKPGSSLDRADRTAPAAAPATAAVAPPVDQASPAASAEPVPAPATGPVIATAPVAAPIPRERAPAATTSRPADSPLGMWQTEKKEGLIRIEACGVNLCGYSVDARTGVNGEKILINMRPVNDAKWSGRIHDPKSGGNYDSTIALKGPDTLQVQGCALGGMFCGGQTWSRFN